MRIQRGLLKLPIRFDGEAMAREIGALPPQAWIAHPQKFDGNIAVPLVSPGGVPVNEWAGPMGPTEWLQRCPTIVAAMQALDSTWGRSRLMGLEPGATVPEHVDVHYYWRTHLRIHIPVITNPQVAFSCGGETVHMAVGECWLLDSFFRHSVNNCGAATRVHLVLDTVGSTTLWDLIEQASGHDTPKSAEAPPARSARPLQFEQINVPAVMSPWEMKSHITYLRSWTDDHPALDTIERILDRFLMGWAGTWARFGASDEGLPVYLQQLSDVQAALGDTGEAILMRNGWPLRDSLQRFVFAHAIARAKLAQHLPAASNPRQFRVPA